MHAVELARVETAIAPCSQRRSDERSLGLMLLAEERDGRLGLARSRIPLSSSATVSRADV
jgi:hypothetical protein